MKPLTCCEINKNNVANYSYCPDCGRYLKGYDATEEIPIESKRDPSSHRTGEFVETHPSYGQLAFSRQSSNKDYSLYGSTVGCRNIIVVRLYKSKRYIDNFTEHFNAEDHTPMFEVELSPSQFAEAITTMNCGSGIPCTIRQVMGRNIPRSNETLIRQRAENQLKGRFKEVAVKIDKAFERLKELRDTKGPLKASERKELIDLYEMFMTEIKSNLPFLNQCINETVDKSIMQAKVEIEAYYTNMVMKLGFSKLEDLLEYKEVKTIEK